MDRRIFTSGVLVGASLLLGGCNDTAGPAGSRAAAAGIYFLQSVDGVRVGQSHGQGTTGGAIYLLPDGGAERRIQYRSGAGSRTFVSKGSFEVDGRSILLALRENDGSSEYVLHWPATLDGHSLTLVYPNPGDGEIHEVYRRR